MELSQIPEPVDPPNLDASTLLGAATVVRRPYPESPTGGGRPNEVHDRTAVNETIRRIQCDGDPRILETLMMQFDWVALNCARRMYRRGESLEDLEQIAREALLGAVERFDVLRGVAFPSFAWSTAMGALRHYYRSRWQVHVPRGLQELCLATARAIEELTATHGRAPTIDELAEHLRAVPDDIILALGAGHGYRADSLDRTLRGNDKTSMCQDRALGAMDEAVEGVADRTRLGELLATLPLRDRTILMMRFYEERTQREIGASLGVSQVQVSRLLRAALCSLRARAGAA
jgi:RNA polymerase sigma-B factor